VAEGAHQLVLVVPFLFFLGFQEHHTNFVEAHDVEGLFKVFKRSQSSKHYQGHFFEIGVQVAAHGSDSEKLLRVNYLFLFNLCPEEIVHFREVQAIRRVFRRAKILFDCV